MASRPFGVKTVSNASEELIVRPIVVCLVKPNGQRYGVQCGKAQPASRCGMRS
jgi:hypothetical protein